MILIFHRRVHKANLPTGADTVSAKIVTSMDGEFHELGKLNFPNKQLWSKFIAALQRGVMSIKDMEIEIENVADTDAVVSDEPSNITCNDENIMTRKVNVGSPK